MITNKELGSYVEKLAYKQNINNKELSETLECTEYQVERFLKGELILTFNKLSILAKKLNISISDLLKGNI